MPVQDLKIAIMEDGRGFHVTRERSDVGVLARMDRSWIPASSYRSSGVRSEIDRNQCLHRAKGRYWSRIRSSNHLIEGFTKQPSTTLPGNPVPTRNERMELHSPKQPLA